MVIKNRRRDLLPMLIQMKNKIWNYKYFCHIHSNKFRQEKFGNAWMDYLYQNLLGSEEIIKDILDIFIIKDKIGFIFPEVFYKSTKLPFMLSYKNKIHLNYVINKIFPGNKVGKKFKYPLSNMFWARVDAIKQVFGHKYIYMLKKKDFENDLILNNHFNEAFWLYVVKMNGYFYKTIFKGI